MNILNQIVSTCAICFKVKTETVNYFNVSNIARGIVSRDIRAFSTAPIDKQVQELISKVKSLLKNCENVL